MKVLIVDDEQHAINKLTKVISQIDPNGESVGFYIAADALAFLMEHEVDIVFLDIEMPGMSGLELAKKIKNIRPSSNIIFVTGHSKYALEAHGLYITGYLLKPATEEKIKETLENLRYPLSKSKSRLRVQTFGNFEVFIDDVPLKFGRAKAKELFAYLVDRKGAAVTLTELASMLWEDKPYIRSLQNQIQTVISDMMKSLKDAGMQDVLIKSRNSFAVNVKAFDCDYYDFMKGDMFAINSFTNEYMTNYSWAEFTVGVLIEQSEKKRFF